MVRKAVSGKEARSLSVGFFFSFITIKINVLAKKKNKIIYKLNASLHWDSVQELELLLFALPCIPILFPKVPSQKVYSNAHEKENLALLNDCSLSIDLGDVIVYITS